MTHVTCRLTAKNRHLLRNPTLGNRVWARCKATFTFFTLRVVYGSAILDARRNFVITDSTRLCLCMMHSSGVWNSHLRKFAVLSSNSYFENMITVYAQHYSDLWSFRLFSFYTGRTYEVGFNFCDKHDDIKSWRYVSYSCSSAVIHLWFIFWR